MDMISIPVAVHNSWFEWQLDFFWHSHKKVYGNDAYKKAHAIIIKRNAKNQNKCESLTWNMDIPHTMCEAHFDYRLNLENSNLMPINIQVGLAQIITKFSDSQVLEILDCDVMHMKKHPQYNIKDNEMYVSCIYEKWHLLSLSTNKHIIEKYFLNGGKYYNGGFVPIIAKTSVFKKILEDWINIHRDLVDELMGDDNRDFRWWAGMYALQAACERNKITMISKNICYLPNINILIDKHYSAHYSCDSRFNKKNYPNIDHKTFEDNCFYNCVLDWEKKSLASSKSVKIFI